jgi:flagellar hook assembly protein FlgD
VKGQKVKTIPIVTPSPAHILSVTWDGTDDSGKPVSSGIYLYQLNVNSKTEAINKMLLLR